MQMRGDKIVSGSWDSTIKAWQFTNSNIVSLPHFNGFESSSAVKSIDLSYDTNICICGTDDGHILLCDQRAPDLRRSLHVHQQTVSSISFSSTSTGLVTGCSDGTIKYIDVRNFAEVYALPSHEAVLLVFLSFFFYFFSFLFICLFLSPYLM